MNDETLDQRTQINFSHIPSICKNRVSFLINQFLFQYLRCKQKMYVVESMNVSTYSLKQCMYFNVYIQMNVWEATVASMVAESTQYQIITYSNMCII